MTLLVRVRDFSSPSGGWRSPKKEIVNNGSRYEVHEAAPERLNNQFFDYDIATPLKSCKDCAVVEKENTSEDEKTLINDCGITHIFYVYQFWKVYF